MEFSTKLASDESPRGLLFSPPAAWEVPRAFWAMGVLEDRAFQPGVEIGPASGTQFPGANRGFQGTSHPTAPRVQWSKQATAFAVMAPGRLGLPGKVCLRAGLCRPGLFLCSPLALHVGPRAPGCSAHPCPALCCLTFRSQVTSPDKPALASS